MTQQRILRGSNRIKDCQLRERVSALLQGASFELMSRELMLPQLMLGTTPLQKGH
jgi:hypothetical protein